MEKFLTVGFLEESPSKKVVQSTIRAAEAWNAALEFEVFKFSDMSMVTIGERTRRNADHVLKAYTNQLHTTISEQEYMKSIMRPKLLNDMLSFCLSFPERQSAILINKAYTANLLVYVHELGHSIGIPHLRGLSIMKHTTNYIFQCKYTPKILKQHEYSFKPAGLASNLL